jgi:hypothetical protein
MKTNYPMLLFCNDEIKSIIILISVPVANREQSQTQPADSHCNGGLQLCGWLFCLFVCFEDEIVYKCQNKI